MDINRDGFVASDEMQSVRGQPQGMRRNGNRMVQGAGGGLDPSKAFDRIDANRDGMISRDEFANGREMRIERKVVINERLERAWMARPAECAKCTAWAQWAADAWATG